MRIWQAIVCEPLRNTDDFIATTPARTAAQTSCQSKNTHKSFLLWISRDPDLFFSCASSSWLPSGPLRVAVLKHIVKAGRVGGVKKYISLLCFAAFFPRHYKAVMGDHGEKRIALLLTSSRPHSNVPPLRDSLLCTVESGRTPPPPQALARLYRRRRRYAVLTWDKCFIQMLLSHIAEEVMNSRAAPAGPVHRVKPELRGLRGSKIKFNVQSATGEGA